MRRSNRQTLDEDKVIVIEPIFKTLTFSNFIRKSVVSLLKSHAFAFHSIRNQDYYVIINLQNDLKLVDAINVLKNISGISLILIGAIVKTDFDIIAKKSISIQSQILFDDEKYFLKVKTMHDVQSTKQKLIHSVFDLEFHIQSELSSSSHGLIRVDTENEADRILYILMGKNISYISLLVLKGKNHIPFNYLNDSVLCPVFDNISLICSLTVMKSGYKAIPIFYYLNKMHLQKLLRGYEEYFKLNSNERSEFYLFSMEEHLSNKSLMLFLTDTNKINEEVRDNTLLWISYQTLVYDFLLKSNITINKIAIPLSIFTHPPWYFENVSYLFEGTGKTLLTPLLFNFTLDDFETQIEELKKFDLGFKINFNDFSRMTGHRFEQLRNIIKINSHNKLKNEKLDYKKITLRMGKDDVFDIFDSI